MFHVTSVPRWEDSLTVELPDTQTETLLTCRYGSLRLFRLPDGGPVGGTLFITPAEPRYVAALLPLLPAPYSSLVLLQLSQHCGYYYLVADGLAATDTPTPWYIVPGDHRACLVIPLDTGRVTHPSLGSVVELPTCPMCLERLDASVTGIPHGMCGGVSGECAACATSNPCPQCRAAASGTNSCAVCHTHDNVWLCSVCGAAGCGRYRSQHAKEHFVATGHAYTMDADTQQVWGYNEDRYVHRLIRGVALPDSGESKKEGIPPTHDKVVINVSKKGSGLKAETQCMEYAHLLSQQLESQRMYFVEEAATAAAQVARERRHRGRDLAGLDAQMCDALKGIKVYHPWAAAVTATRIAHEETAGDGVAIAALEVLQGTLKTAALDAMRSQGLSGPPVTAAGVVTQLRLDIADMERHVSMSRVAKKKLSDGEADGGVTIVVGEEKKRAHTKKR